MRGGLGKEGILLLDLPYFNTLRVLLFLLPLAAVAAAD